MESPVNEHRDDVTDRADGEAQAARGEAPGEATQYPSPGETCPGGAREEKPPPTRAFRKLLIVLGAFVFAYNASLVAHELGHALGAVATGGKVSHIEISPLSRSLARFDFNPEPRATIWAGFLGEVALGMLAFFILWIVGSRFTFWGLALAIASLAGAGSYMLAGVVFLPYGDPGYLIYMGISPVALALIGVCLILLCLLLLLAMGPLLGIGRGRTRFHMTLLVLSPIVVYVLGRAVYIIVSLPFEVWIRIAVVGGGLAVAGVVSFLVHWSARWTIGPESQRRAVRAGWGTAAFSILLGAGIVVAELVAFPRRPGRAMPLYSLCYFRDANNLAGFHRPFSSRAEAGLVFWRVDGDTRSVFVSARVRAVAWFGAIDKLLVLTSKGLYCTDESDVWLSPYMPEHDLAPVWASNADMTRLLLVTRDVGSGRRFLLALDLKTGRQTSEEFTGFFRGMVFLDDTSCVAYLQAEVVTASFDEPGDCRFVRWPNPFPDECPVATLEGRAVILRPVSPSDRNAGYHLDWNGKSVRLPRLEAVQSFGGGLVAAARDGTVYRIDSSFNVRTWSPPWQSRLIGSGVCDDGVWLAYEDGHVRLLGQTDRTVQIELP